MTNELAYAVQTVFSPVDYYGGGSLKQQLKRKGKFTFKEVRFFVAELTLGIGYLHNVSI